MRLTISIIVSGLCDYRQICAKASILETLMQQAQDDAACAKDVYKRQAGRVITSKPSGTVPAESGAVSTPCT